MKLVRSRFPSITALTKAKRLVPMMLLGAWICSGRAATYPLPTDGNIIGHVRVVTVNTNNTTLLDIARHYDLGYNEITSANPGISIWLPGKGSSIIVPSEFVLPPKPWIGIVINISQRRLFYFPNRLPKEPATVATYPIGIARSGWPTPLGMTSIVAKKKKPSWTVPQDILDEHRNGDNKDFPDYFPPGRDNPMGMLALETGFSQIYIHGTDRPWGVGMRVSHGCIHLYPEDEARLFDNVSVGTPVRIIDEPVQVGRRGGVLYLSISKPTSNKFSAKKTIGHIAMDALIQFYADQGTSKLPPIDWDRVKLVAKAPSGIPSPISVGAPSIGNIISAIKPEKYDLPPYGIDANDASVPPNSY